MEENFMTAVKEWHSMSSDQVKRQRIQREGMSGFEETGGRQRADAAKVKGVWVWEKARGDRRRRLRVEVR